MADDLLNLPKKASVRRGRDHAALVGILSRVRELRGLSGPQLARIARLKTVYWGPDQFILVEGRGDWDHMIILLTGKVYVRKRVFKEGGATFEQMAELAAPTILGEDSFFTGLKRSASVYAREKVAGIVIERDDFNRLICLDRNSGVSFLRMIVEEGVQRAERTLVLYIGTLQLLMSAATISRCGFHKRLEAFTRGLPDKNAEMERWRSCARGIMMEIRELNGALEELYYFANLPKTRALSVNHRRFALERNHRFHNIFKTLVEELSQLQELVSLDTVDVKNAIISAVTAEQDQGLATVDYPTIVSIATEAYKEFMANHTMMGFEAEVASAGDDDAERIDKMEDSLLWENPREA